MFLATSCISPPAISHQVCEEKGMGNLFSVRTVLAGYAFEVRRKMGLVVLVHGRGCGGPRGGKLALARQFWF